ncbi:hypothetical protein DS891_17215 [Pseudoalteromonas sp. JC28]|nr:hypothetical protein [Pseudoalteromonas sp. JC28]
MYIEKITALFLSTFSAWGFLFALLYNLAIYSGNRQERLEQQPIFYSAVMFISFLITIPIVALFLLPSDSAVNTWEILRYNGALIVMDLLTMFTLTLIPRGSARVGNVCYSYLQLCMSFSIVIFLAAACFGVYYQYLPSWLRQFFLIFYPLGSNANDLVMVSVLVIRRDFLGLHRLYRRLLNSS